MIFKYIKVIYVYKLILKVKVFCIFIKRLNMNKKVILAIIIVIGLLISFFLITLKFKADRYYIEQHIETVGYDEEIEDTIYRLNTEMHDHESLKVFVNWDEGNMFYIDSITPIRYNEMKDHIQKNN